jgi:TPR repeat protein
MLKQLLFLILVMAITVPAFGESLDKDFIAGRKAHQAGDYNRAFTVFKACAEKGHCGCMNSLGNCYLEGLGVEKDINEAIRWHRAAYETGAKCGPAGLYSALYLARIYAKGQGVKRNPIIARSWCNKALALLEDPKLSKRLGSKGTESYRKRIKKMLSTLR